MDIVLEDLQYKGLMIYQPAVGSGYRFTSDAVALANFAKVKKDGVLLDLCSGSGVVGILAGAKNVVSHVYMVELQKSLADMCGKSVQYNQLDNHTIINTNVVGVNKMFKNIHIDTITCNPPYYDRSSASVELTEIAVAKQEIELTLQDVIVEAGKILKDGGKLYLCHKMSRLCDIMVYLRQNLLEPKELKILPETKNDPTILVKAVKQGEKGLKIV